MTHANKAQAGVKLSAIPYDDSLNNEGNPQEPDSQRELAVPDPPIHKNLQLKALKKTLSSQRNKLYW